MAQNVTIAGNAYNGVSAVTLPKSGGGIAVFPDTSDATASAGDIAAGKTAYVGGVKLTGTASAGYSGSQNGSFSPSSNQDSYTITGLSAEPKLLICCLNGESSTSTTKFMESFVYEKNSDRWMITCAVSGIADTFTGATGINSQTQMFSYSGGSAVIRGYSDNKFLKGRNYVWFVYY